MKMKCKLRNIDYDKLAAITKYNINLQVTQSNKNVKVKEQFL